MAPFFAKPLKNSIALSKFLLVAAQRLIDRDRADKADRGGRRIEIADHALVIGLQQILPARRHRLAAERILVHEQAERAVVDRVPVAFRILQAGRNVVKALRLVRLQHACLFRLVADVDAHIGDIGDRIAFLSDQLRQRLSGILVVMRDVVAEVRFDGLEHRSPVGPLRRAVVADHVGGLCRTAQRQSGERNKGETEQLDFHGYSSPARHLCG